MLIMNAAPMLLSLTGDRSAAMGKRGWFKRFTKKLVKYSPQAILAKKAVKLFKRRAPARTITPAELQKVQAVPVTTVPGPAAAIPSPGPAAYNPPAEAYQSPEVQQENAEEAAAEEGPAEETPADQEAPAEEAPAEDQAETSGDDTEDMYVGEDNDLE